MFEKMVLVVVFAIVITLVLISYAVCGGPDIAAKRSGAVVDVAISGRLGNQLFQCATAYAYGQKYNKRVISARDCETCKYFDTCLKWVDTSRTFTKWDNQWSEPTFGYTEIPEMSGDVKLTGYMQSPRYFQHVRSELLTLIKNNIAPFEDNAITDAIKTDITVSMHIRRGDYVAASLHPVQTIDYYTRALQSIEKRVGHVTVAIFSDDIPWCKRNLTFQRMLFVEPTLQLTEQQELLLMSMCAHHIIANSSFSWWGSFLNDSKTAITVAPAHWFNTDDHSMDWQDVYVDTWIRL